MWYSVKKPGEKWQEGLHFKFEFHVIIVLSDTPGLHGRRPSFHRRPCNSATIWAPWKTGDAGKMEALAKTWWMNRVVQAKRGWGRGSGKELEAGWGETERSTQTWEQSWWGSGSGQLFLDRPHPGILEQAEESGSLKAVKEGIANTGGPCDYWSWALRIY